MRTICYVSGTRADFGLMRSTLRLLDSHSELQLFIAVTGMHLLPDYGLTVREIETEGFNICSKIQVALSGASGAEMAIALAKQVEGFTLSWQKQRPDIVVLLGDRGEMLAAAIAAVHLNIYVLHIHGGERSGTIDESFRHAITKLAHFHCAATQASKDRLVKMGENANHIVVSGAPGLDEIEHAQLLNRDTLCKKYGLDSDKVYELILFHPVVQQVGDLSTQMEALLQAVSNSCQQPLVLLPNADSGAGEITAVIQRHKDEGYLQTITHASRGDYLSLLAHSSVLIGNSSSGIIEAASLATPVVNVGQRQNARERNVNVIDVATDQYQIEKGIKYAKNMPTQGWVNVYGDGCAGARIVDFLCSMNLHSSVLEKINVY